MPVSATSTVRTLTTNANVVDTLYMAKRFVETLRQGLIALQFADDEVIPLHAGTITRWNFWANPTASTDALTEGDDRGDSTTLDTTKIEGTLAKYGDYFEITEELEEDSVDGTKTAFVDAAAYQARLSIDTIVHTELITTTSVQDGGTAMKVSTLRAAQSTLRTNNARFHPKSTGGSYFPAILAVEQADDMSGEGNPAWFQVKVDTNPQNLERPMPKSPGESPSPSRSALYNCEVYVSTNVQVDTAATVNDLGLLLSFNSFGISSHRADVMQPRVAIVPPSPSLASPNGVRGLVSWKVRFVVKLFDSLRVIKIKTDQT